MSYTATITSKNQLTLPAKVVKNLGLKKGEKLSVLEKNGRIILTPMQQIVEQLAGSWELPRKWQGKDLDEIVEESRQEYLQGKYKNQSIDK